jgi:UDP-N-acetylglucosamine 2-epimerase (non-hydrolysing)
VESLNDIFFRDLKVRQPDYHLGIRSEWLGEQIGRIISETEKLIVRNRPDGLLVLGDTNSGLSAIAAKRHGIPVYHMEAGNRCYDDRVPEEINRRIIDHSSDVLMPYTHRSKENLVREGIERERIFVIGNPIFEVLQHHEKDIASSSILKRLDIRAKEYFLVTMHRAENVDVQTRLHNVVKSLVLIAEKSGKPIICSLHPRTRSKMEQFGITSHGARVRWLEPPGFFDFVSLEQNALCVLSDSGTVQEECCIFRVPNVTIRDVTERPETIECGSNILSGTDPDQVVSIVEMVMRAEQEWKVPEEYTRSDVSTTVLKILLGFRPALRRVLGTEISGFTESE